MPNYFKCPVCYYPFIEEEPYGELGGGSFEICPQCGIEYGVEGASLDELDDFLRNCRESWINGGKKWWAYWMPVEDSGKPRNDN